MIILGWVLLAHAVSVTNEMNSTKIENIDFTKIPGGSRLLKLLILLGRYRLEQVILCRDMYVEQGLIITVLVARSEGKA